MTFGRSRSATERLTRGSRARLRALREPGEVRKRTRSSSVPTQIGTLWGPPSGRTVARWAMFGASSSARTSSVSVVSFGRSRVPQLIGARVRSRLGMPRELPPKVDVHAHFLPADYREALLANGHERPDGFPILPEWSPEGHLEVLDRLGIGTAMLSVSSPGVAFGEDADAWARGVNETGAATVRAHPDRFGLLASLPLPDVDAALAELRHAFD